jgi:hypothetical protein
VLTVLALATIVGLAAIVAAAAARVVDAFDRRRLRRVRAQVWVTDAIHGVVGAIVAPTVAGQPGKRWTVAMGLEPRDLVRAGLLTEIVRQALGRDGTGVTVVFTPRG